MIIINTGNGKGKTTASIGQIIRFLGHGFKVCLIQLFKEEYFYGEQNILIKLNNLDFFSFSMKHPYFTKNTNFTETVNGCLGAMKKLEQLSNIPKKYDLIVLEEFNIALRDRFICESKFINIVKQLSQKSNIIITGRDAPDMLIDIADLVTEMKEIKHPYKIGIKATKGIEF
ncbi:MAG: cob(I)yrinic acid a,c-diamide adenosyltransferase [Endomicrobium sp.]|jgi:cob(I)alamin adenosyltransferase|nr:cob(I)yrinic acid a,c-diamide adenosyltransferase [Endomicrobium sp.]